ncbi:MAG: ABC transporter permease [Gemmataceae bacterium]|nr:ABC transporter permease [Gemmataceae bacterium]
MTPRFSWQRLFSVARKESLHIRRDAGTLFFALFIPVLELFMLGYAIDTNIRDLSTVVLDQANTVESRRLIQSFCNTKSFRIVDYPVRTSTDLYDAIVAGKARVGIQIPEDFSRRTERPGGRPAEILILIDGSESNIAGTALNVSNALALRDSLQQALQGATTLPVEARPQILFNPDTRSPNFFIPGLIVVMCQMMAIMLSANAIVREKENGTLEQLFMTPVQAPELILGKLLPYLVLTFIEFCAILGIMRVVFQVPIRGQVLTLLALTLPFVFTFLGLGLLISTRVNTREAAGQAAMGTMMPSIFLSGYVFPLDSMPWVFYYIAQIFPTTWLIDAARGVILRGAGWRELWIHAVVLWSMGATVFGLSMLKFHKRLT